MCSDAGWTEYSGLDCSNDHGAYELGTSTGDLALQECQGVCDNNYLINLKHTRIKKLF